MNSKLRVAFGLSGGGTTVDHALGAITRGFLTGITPACIFATKPEAGGIEKANKWRVANPGSGLKESDVIVVDRKKFHRADGKSGAHHFSRAILQELKLRGIELVALLGFLPTADEILIEAYWNMIFGSHPAPLDPGHLHFGGEGLYSQAPHCAVIKFWSLIARSGQFTEASCIRVRKELDAGAVIGRKRMDFPLQFRAEISDDVASLQTRLLDYEYALVIETMQKFADGTVQELVRTDRLVLPGEEFAHTEAIATARRLYPKG